MLLATDLADLVATTPTAPARAVARAMIDRRCAPHDLGLAAGPAFPTRVGVHDGRGGVLADLLVADASEAFVALAKLLTVVEVTPGPLEVCFDPRVRAGVGRPRAVPAAPLDLAA